MAPSYYESDRGVSEYLLFHYGAPAVVLPWPGGPTGALNFAERCVSECLDVSRLRPSARALDLGCAVGRSSFELARHCESVLGIDASQRFVEAARALVRDGEIAFEYVDEGELKKAAVARVPTEVDRRRVTFEHGDAMRVPPELGDFDAVLMANLIDRLPDPAECVRQLPRLVREGGQLIITSPYTWLPEYTDPARWLGGFEREGCPVKTLDTLRTLLEPDFVLHQQLNLPLLLREHARKFQWSVAEATVWIRR